MLMESGIKDSLDAAIAKKPRSLDLQTLYDQKPGLSVDKKRNHGNDDGSGVAKKKSKKEVPLSSVPSGRKFEKCLDEVYKGGSSSDLNKTESGPSQKSDDRANGFDVISLNMGNGIPQIPKRKRGLVQRKKADVSNRLKLEGSLGGKVSSSDVAADLNAVSKGKTGQDGEVNGNSKGSYSMESLDVDKKGKRKKGFNEQKESGPTKVDLLRLLKTENGNSHAHSNDPSSNKKVKRTRNKREEVGLKTDDAVKDAKPMFQHTTRSRDEPQEDDEEENLEANAARMLSSRFDPSCTGFPSAARSSTAPSMVPLCRDDADHGSNLLDSDISSDDIDLRVLRPRDQCIKKGVLRKRRHFYEVLSKDVDAHWMVKRKIKVYWPLDQIWYFGKVLGYDPKNMLHHIKYDDREEEWIDLRNERLKLLMFPSELPLNAGGRRRRGSGTKGKHDVKVMSDAKVQDGYPISSQMECEPIIKWLARPTGQMKSSSIRSSKKHKTSDQTGKACPSLSTATNCTASKTVDIRSAQNSADKLLSNPGLSDSSYGKEVARTSPIESSSRYSIVYFRRGVRRKESDSLAVLSNGSHATELCSVELPHFDDELVILNLTVPVMNSEVFRLKLNFLPFLAPYYSFGVENLWLFHSALMLQHGTLMCLWPRVHLELFLVDNFKGLRFLSFEGCLLQAIAFVFSILSVFHQSNQQRKHGDQQLPVTSIWFQFSSLEDLTKQLVFALHNFCGLETSRWVSLDRIFQKHCCIAKQLTPSECTYENIKALENGSNQLNLTSVSLEPSSRSHLRRGTRHPMIGASANVNHSQTPAKGDGKWERLPSFALSFSAAPTFILSLQLKLLMECSAPDMGNNSASVSCEDAEIIPKSCRISQVLDDDCLNKGNELNTKQRDSSEQPSCPKDQCSELEVKTTYYPLSGITVEIPLFDSHERPSSGGLHNGESSELARDVTDGAIFSPTPPPASSSLHTRQVGISLLGNLSGGKPDLLCSGPKKPRTHVSYSVPPEDHDCPLKDRGNLTKGFSSKRIRRASMKKELDTPRNYPRNAESLSCDVNVLIFEDDRGWREGARVVLEPVDDSEWRLAVKISDCTRYAYKAHQFLQSGSTNRYTHAMMWKGGKDWTLEFPERSQWTLFKEIYQECYNRNLRAALVKNIPIPGVCLIEENDDNGVEVPFIHSSRYIRQLQTDVDIAMDPSCVIYDMDSDDELWISKIRSSDVENCETGNISEEMFEKIMDTLEKVAYANQQDHFTSDELEQLIFEGEPVESIKIIYEHWREKRQKRGMPLLRHLQPPLWEKYQKQVKEFESAMSKSNGTVSTGCHGKAIEKPPLYAFCMKPRGLTLPYNRGTKHRSHKKHPVTRHVNAGLGDPESFHIYGSGHYSPNNDGYIHYPRLHRTKSRKIGSLVSPNDRQVVSPHSQRFMSNRNGMQAWNTHQSEWASPRYFHPDGPQRLSFKHLDPADLDEFRLRDASSAAQHAVIMAKLKRENAQRLLYKADLAIHKAVVALMTAEAIKASHEDSTNDASSEG